ncbi:MAG: anthranilate synthase component I family protein [Leptospiraceae bacterium]|nr:anthranilate synthase component I family protein [Leptospiraceae bacterium]MCK6381970.1 anthranilate synthase component I family protein [Leptospiraceae bacterium]NUM40308.1 anthranilate synthase component I family protein [Leptospiraceae bacterium]
MSIPKIQLSGKANYRKIDENIDFYELFQKIEKETENCFYLESLGREGYDSRYSIIGLDPEIILTGKENSIQVGEESFQTENPYYELRRIIPSNVLSRNYSGGLVGYIGYEAINYFEPSLKLQTHQLFPIFQFGVYEDGLILDKMTGEVFYFHFEKDRFSKVEKFIRAKVPKPENPIIKSLGYSMTKEEHREKVLAAIEEIKSGNTFQCQVGFKSEFEIRGDSLPIYSELRQINPSPHMFYLKFSDKRLIGASPELLFRLRNGEIESFPLAGSIKRGDYSEEDLKLAKILLNNPKEIAEHNMLVDLHRNDVGRVAKFGTVKVRRLMDIKKFSHIQHISSEVTGIIKKREDMFSGLATSFPAGTLSGAPKIESMKIIERLENNPRGPYGGALGHFGFNGDCTFAIPIRTLFISGSYAFTQASGGIVYDSTPEGEYDEVIRKSAAIEKVIKKFSGNQ